MKRCLGPIDFLHSFVVRSRLFDRLGQNLGHHGGIGLFVVDVAVSARRQVGLRRRR